VITLGALLIFGGAGKTTGGAGRRVAALFWHFVDFCLGCHLSHFVYLVAPRF